MNKPENNLGFSLIVNLIAITLLGITTVHFMNGIANTQKSIQKTHSAAVADLMASELLELFRAHTNTQFNARFPVPAGRKLCTPINLLDRATDVITDADPVATLPAGILGGNIGNFAPNRSYQIQVMNIKTLAVNDCGVVPAALPYTLGLDETFLVTVTVSYVPAGEDLSQLSQRSIMTALAQ